MTESARSQGFIAVFAAYVLALQALLLPLSVLAGAPGSTLCLSAASSGAGQPTDHPSGCPCAAGCGLQCCAQTSVLPPQIVVARAVAQVAASLPSYLGEQFQPAGDFGSHHPRAPPAA
jgi:hypothetical protein